LSASFIFLSVLNYFDLQSSYEIDIFTRALEYDISEEPEEESNRFLYYGSSSVFSNLSRGLPVDAEVPSTEPETLNEQPPEQGENPNSDGENQEQQP
ncbi:MAG: hypothetical protein ACRD8Z_28480, partial [Nitrososphaeraceae archaeon]